ncbi:MAG: (d)CMP kinase [Pseudomonadota bacterium]
MPTAPSSEPTKPKVIALDGPAASGKGTLARRLAAHYGFAHLDTGVLYRGVAWMMMNDGWDTGDADAAGRYARAFSLDQIEGAPIRSREVGAGASKVAAVPAVRAALLQFQRRFASNPPGGAAGAILDGRDIGTVVCPDACVKFFITASPEARAKRRWLELREEKPDLTEAAILEDIRERDARDAARKDAPMKPSEDAEIINTTDLTEEAVSAAAQAIIDDAFARKSD